MWWRPILPLRGSVESLWDGKTNCHAHCLAAAGYFRSSVKTTMIYTHVLNRGGLGVKSPADLI